MISKRDLNSSNVDLLKIQEQLKMINTATLVKVVAVNTKSKKVTVEPLIQLYDQQNNPITYSKINDIPYTRLQGGSYGIICDPVVGDTGLVVFCSRDISNIVKGKNEKLPASERTHSISDAIYIASILMSDPKTYIKINEDGIEIQGRLTVSEDVIIDGKSFNNHIHGNGNNGDNTTKPVII